MIYIPILFSGLNFGVSQFSVGFMWCSGALGTSTPCSFEPLMHRFFSPFIMNSNVAMFLQILELLKNLSFEFISYMDNIIESAICYSLLFFYMSYYLCPKLDIIIFDHRKKSYSFTTYENYIL